jgi:hypothetical protein
MAFAPRLATLPAAQSALWAELKATPEQFALYGGTALALRLGHRASVDFDFFSNDPFDPEKLASAVPYLKNAEHVQVSANTLTCRIDRGGPVLVSFFGDLGIGRVEPPEHTSDTGLLVASLLDLGGTKAAVIQKRAEVKDYLDVYALLGSGITLAQMLAAGLCVYGKSFNPLITVKALSYFGDLPELTPAVQARLRRASAETDTTRLPFLIPFQPRRRDN